MLYDKGTLYFSGHTLGKLSCNECECTNNLIVGSIIAEELRNTLKEKFNLTTSAGNDIVELDRNIGTSKSCRIF